MSPRRRAAATGLAGVCIVLALAHDAEPLPRATNHPAAPSRAAAAQAVEATTPPPWLSRLTMWVAAVSEHQPGKSDEPAWSMGQWGEFELNGVRGDYLALLKLYRRAVAAHSRPEDVVYKDERFTLPRIAELLGMSSVEAARGDPNRIFRCGAVLHADVEMLAISDLLAVAGCSARSVVVTRAGRRFASGCSGVHWDQARALLDAIEPDPGKDAVVRLWYEATIAYLLDITDYANSAPHLARGHELFPSDSFLLFEEGRFHEAFASPHMQAVARDNPEAKVKSASSHLKTAEERYASVLDRDPSFVEARLRRGAVLGQLGRHDEAAAELRRVVAAAEEPLLRYYGELWLGREEQALGHRSLAQAHYQAAAGLVPAGQSPRLALGLLARGYGDRAVAGQAVRQALTLPHDAGGREDPWWTYYKSMNPWPDVLLRRLYGLFPAGGPR